MIEESGRGQHRCHVGCIYCMNRQGAVVNRGSSSIEEIRIDETAVGVGSNDITARGLCSIPGHNAPIHTDHLNNNLVIGFKTASKDKGGITLHIFRLI